MTNASTKNGSNGVHPDAAITSEHDLLWDSLSPKVVTELEKPLDPSLVSQRKGRAGRTYQYIEGHTVIDQANRIFGLAGWGYEVVGDVTLREIDSVDPKTGEVSRIRAYSAPVRVTVPGAPPRTDIGFHAVAEETAEGHGHSLQRVGYRRSQASTAQLRRPVRELPLRRPGGHRATGEAGQRSRLPCSVAAVDADRPGGDAGVRREAGAGCGQGQDGQGP